ncbi:GNAT family N-acetyltransferase [Mycobacterium hodleri]|uniref:GNAT family N-acetyltransferase n=1 Tax=Mycolicibacterium hodleri TaxID=49897 RepID=UPI0021F28C94|nr:GNAT family N-acetyltransferase [Mycolicibacterium hodleri]MCV7131979.1 GNAT family N-acetyltransferase [Mycolicibacterium hodleri]
MSESHPRRATHDDVEGIRRLVAAAFGKYVDRIGRPPAPMSADYAELLETSRVWVVDHRDEIVGVLVTQAQPNHLLLDVVAVAPTAQGGGHGRVLLSRADQDAREQDLKEIRLCTNQAMTENLEFYPRQGFRETSRGVQDGYHRVFFAKAVLADGPPSPTIEE